MDNYKKKRILLAFFDSRIKTTQSEINLLRRKRRQHLLNVLLHQKLQMYYTLLLNNRSEWVHTRHGCFWEKDVPLMTDQQFIENFRMTRQTFQLLCSKMKNFAKRDTTYRKCIPLEKRVAIALYTLKSSSEFASIEHMFGVSKSSVCNILNSFCYEAWNVLYEEYLPPNIFTEDKIKECVDGFKKLGFPQCFGAIDGCHIEVQPPASEASDYHNYKGWYSTILLAVVDYRYRFLYINVGCPGKCNDSSIYESSKFRQKMKNPLFKEKSVVYSGVQIPVMLMGDSAFRLSDCMMKPYPFHVNASIRERTFNYTLSKCRRVVENAFGHLKARFRRLGKGLDNKLYNVNQIIKCCCVLHNFLNHQNEKINETWQQSSTVETSNRPQPNYEEFIYDFNPKAEEIRNAIASSLINN